MDVPVHVFIFRSLPLTSFALSYTLSCTIRRNKLHTLGSQRTFKEANTYVLVVMVPYPRHIQVMTQYEEHLHLPLREYVAIVIFSILPVGTS